MAIRKSFLRSRFFVPEQASCVYKGQLLDEAGQPIPNTKLATLTLTVYSIDDVLLPIVNAIDHVNILNADRGALDSRGQLTITLRATDNVILQLSLQIERHRMLLEWSSLAGFLVGKHEVDFAIQRLARI